MSRKNIPKIMFYEDSMSWQGGKKHRGERKAMKKLVTTLIGLAFILGLSAVGYSQVETGEKSERSKTVIQQETKPTDEFEDRQRTQTEVQKKEKTVRTPLGTVEKSKTKAKVEEQEEDEE